MWFVGLLFRLFVGWFGLTRVVCWFVVSFIYWLVCWLVCFDSCGLLVCCFVYLLVWFGLVCVVGWFGLVWFL